METETKEKNEDTSSVASIKTVRAQLETRIDTQHNTHLDVLASLQNLVPGIVSSLDLSLHLISKFNNRTFNPTPPLPEVPKLPPKHQPHQPHLNHDAAAADASADDAEERDRGGDSGVEDGGSPLALVRAMVAVCLLQRVPFTAIDSSMLLRKLESDSNAMTSAEKRALREVGGEFGAVLAVEMALRSIAEEGGGLELEEFSVSGKSRVIVLGIDRIRLLRELPENVQQNQDLNALNGSNTGSANQGGQMELYGMQRPEMWDPHLAGVYPGGGGMMGPRGRGLMGMQRGGMSIRQQNRTEEDDWNDIHEMLNKKTYKESQRSKTGEELLDLIQRPTAKETAVAAKV